MLKCGFLGGLIKNTASDNNMPIATTTVPDSHEYKKTRAQKFSLKSLQFKMVPQHCEMKKKLVTDEEGMLVDYESESEMSEEYMLKYLENEL